MFKNGSKLRMCVKYHNLLNWLLKIIFVIIHFLSATKASKIVKHAKNWTIFLKLCDKCIPSFIENILLSKEYYVILSQNNPQLNIFL